MPSHFVQIQVEEHEELPEGCSLRFRAQAEGRAIETVRWESESGTRGVWRVSGRTSTGDTTPAIAYPVDDSSAGTSILIAGGDRGLCLIATETGETVIEPYLLVSRDAALLD